MDIHKLCGILWGVTRFCPQPQVKTKGNTLLHCLRLSVSIRNCHFVTVPEFSEQHTSIGLQLDITLFDSIGYIFFVFLHSSLSSEKKAMMKQNTCHNLPEPCDSRDSNENVQSFTSNLSNS